MAGFWLSNPGFLAVVRPVIDPDARAIITATETADGQPIELTAQNAINSFVVGCKDEGIWTSLAAGVFRLLAGPRTLAGIFKCGVGVDPSNIGFVSGDYVRATGLKGNDSSKLLNLNRAANADAQTNRASAIFVTQSNTGGFGVPIGSGLAAVNGADHLGFNTTVPEIVFRSLTPVNDLGIVTNIGTTSLEGFVGMSRTLSTSFSARWLQSSTTQNQNAVAPVADSTFLFNRVGGATGTAPFNGRIAFYFRGPSINLALLDARIATYMSSISGI